MIMRRHNLYGVLFVLIPQGRPCYVHVVVVHLSENHFAGFLSLT